MGSATLVPWRVFQTPKRGNSDDEYEDAWASQPGAGRFAVADGASESSYSGLWAKLLAETFVAAKRPWDSLDWLDDARQKWSAEVDGQEMAWYAEMKREQGAYATLLGLSLRRAARGKPGLWRAWAVGDSCLMRLRAGGPPRAFPLNKSADFGNQPNLVGSRPGTAPVPVVSRGVALPGDRFFLMTDALAQWFLHRCETKRRPWVDLKQLLTEPETEGGFMAWIDNLRDHEDLRNDDVTLLAVGPVPKTTKLAKE